MCLDSHWVLIFYLYFIISKCISNMAHTCYNIFGIKFKTIYISNIYLMKLYLNNLWIFILQPIPWLLFLIFRIPIYSNKYF